MRSIVLSVSVLALMACTPPVPESGVGFDTLGRSEREQQLQTGIAPQPTTVLPPVAVGPLDPVDPAAQIAAEATEALAETAPQSPVLNRNNPEISQEQDFEVVAAERDIEADAARIAAARQQFQLVRPKELEPVGDTGPNIIQYALSASHPVGQKLYRRGNPFAAARLETKCAGYRTADVAQEQFLAAGGPSRDRLGLDPDGDGYACDWDPATFRDLVRN
ncbi:hypothetical protein [Thalassobacter stenotrophicus]|uniref:Excalibur calcium-binding domain-containing protein n=2 Tax=Thalassobacter stenotrophicus TaxID=266809 RepID=A0A0P1F107_9RHOB|nr:hypothetical protein [Thalassobacter stenotrophicus]CUH61251.1 hypothetical protein THS5294_02554 [Thalassobacter stenotrophicus]SHI60700.1 hypothetical protein SAMN02744035_01081 [Thalassobacter stenotrophicus DSM 16310]